MTHPSSPRTAAPSPLTRTVDLFLPAAGGSEALLAEEVQRLTERPAQAGRGGVWAQGDGLQALRLNLESRIAQRVLWPLVDGPYRDEHDLYDLARRVPWPDWITPAQTLRVDVNAQGSPLRSVNFAALRIKDAVCDVMREATGEPFMVMPSGAAHDTMCVADKVPTAMVFVPCVDGLSHTPLEDSDTRDAALAAEIVLGAIIALQS